MNKKTNQSSAQTTIAFLSAIAASSFLGLPVLAQTKKPPGQPSVRCVPVSTSSNSTQVRGNDTKPSNVDEYPNQADPRAGVNPSSSTAGTPSTAGDVTEGTTSNQPNQHSTQSNGQMSGKCPPGMTPINKNPSVVPDRNIVPREQTSPTPGQTPIK